MYTLLVNEVFTGDGTLREYMTLDMYYSVGPKTEPIDESDEDDDLDVPNDPVEEGDI